VTARFGPATRWVTGDAGGTETKVCYSVPTGSGPRYVYFTSSELGGFTDVTGVRVVTPGQIDSRPGSFFVNGLPKTSMQGSRQLCAAPQRNGAALRAAIDSFGDAAAVARRLKSLGFAQTRPGAWSREFQEQIQGATYDNYATVTAQWRGGALVKLELTVAETN
jgi:hypothetical protein